MNQIFAFHVDGQLLTGKFWREYKGRTTKWDRAFWRPSKTVYMRWADARLAFTRLPSKLQKIVEIVEYTPKGN